MCACARARAHALAHVPRALHAPHAVHARTRTDTLLQVEIYKDLKTDVDTHKDWPTASTCARTIYLPVFAEEQHFLEKLQRALDEFKAKNSNWGGAEFGYA